LEVLLKGDEPLKNVSRSVIELGHRLLSAGAETDLGNDLHRLLIEKN
jgi:hypothetical protein